MKKNQTISSLVIGTDINFHVDTDDIYIGTESRIFFIEIIKSLEKNA